MHPWYENGSPIQETSSEAASLSTLAIVTAASAMNTKGMLNPIMPMRFDKQIITKAGLLSRAGSKISPDIFAHITKKLVNNSTA